MALNRVIEMRLIEDIESKVMTLTDEIKAVTKLLTKEHGDPTLGLRDYLGTLGVNLRVLCNRAHALTVKINTVRE